MLFLLLQSSTTAEIKNLLGLKEELLEGIVPVVLSMKSVYISQKSDLFSHTGSHAWTLAAVEILSTGNTKKVLLYTNLSGCLPLAVQCYPLA